MKKVKLVTAEDVQEQHLAAVENTVWAESLEPLVAFLVRTKYDDGEVRKPGEVRIRTKGRSWEVQLIDVDGRAHCRLVASTLDDVLAMACLGLESEELPWELADWLPKPVKRK